MEKDEYIPSARATMLTMEALAQKNTITKPIDTDIAIEFMKIIDRIFTEYNLGKWNQIDTAPKDGSYILVAGDSGYTSTPFRCATAKWSFDKRCWVNHANDRFTDGGPEPIYWLPLPSNPSQSS